MTIEFRCGQCNQLLRVPDNSAGKNARCPKCQALMQVPAASPESAAFGAPGNPAPPPPLPAQSLPPAPTFVAPSPPPPKSDDPFAFLSQSAPASAAPSVSLPPPPKPFADASGTPPTSTNPYAAGPMPQGYGQAYGQAYGASQHNPAPMMLAVGSLLTACMGLLSCACCVFLPFPAISLLLGVIALCIKPDKNARIVAILGIALSVVSLILVVVGIVLGLVSASLDPQFQQGLGN
jgi:phage FluMu protein Com